MLMLFKMVLLLSLLVTFSLKYLALVPQIPTSLKWRIIILLLMIDHEGVLKDLLNMSVLKIVD